MFRLLLICYSHSIQETECAPLCVCVCNKAKMEEGPTVCRQREKWIGANQFNGGEVWALCRSPKSAGLSWPLGFARSVYSQLIKDSFAALWLVTACNGQWMEVVSFCKGECVKGDA